MTQILTAEDAEDTGDFLGADGDPGAVDGKINEEHFPRQPVSCAPKSAALKGPRFHRAAAISRLG